MHDVRARCRAQAAATRLAALALCCAWLTVTQGCRGGDREVVFPTESGDWRAGDAGMPRDASMPRDTSMPPDDEDPGAPGNGGDASDAGKNRRPLADRLELELDEDTSIREHLSGSDLDGDALSFELVDTTAHGELTLDAESGQVTYVPDPDFFGEDGFRFRVNDGNVDSASAWVEIEVSPVNDVPEVHGDSVDTNEDTAVELTLLVREVDGDGVAYEIVNGPEHGTLKFVAAPDAVYTPDANYSGVDSFSFRVNDGAADSGLATVTIAVAAINDPPIASGNWLRVVEGGTTMQLVGGGTSLLANDSDLDGDALSLATTPAANPAHGTVTLNANGTFSYAHHGGEAVSDSFNYEVCDNGTPSYCVTATVAVTIVAANDAPMAVDDTLHVARGGTAVMLAAGTDSVLDNDVDANDDALTVTVENDVISGTLMLNANGTFSYLHDGSETTSDSFAYEVCDDAAPPLCDTATVTIEVTPVR